jgi:hypothetical protein
VRQASLSAMALVHACDAWTTPSARYPDLYTVANVLIACSVFCTCLAYFTFHQLRLPHPAPASPPMRA